MVNDKRLDADTSKPANDACDELLSWLEENDSATID
jgi:hypothetical protein